jgi:hypothetical protein
MRGRPAAGLPAVKALTLRQPWAWAAIYGGKDVENRRWKTRHRGPLLIHAGIDVDAGGSASVLKTIADPDGFARPRIAWAGARSNHRPGVSCRHPDRLAQSVGDPGLVELGP